MKSIKEQIAKRGEQELEMQIAKLNGIVEKPAKRQKKVCLADLTEEQKKERRREQMRKGNQRCRAKKKLAKLEERLEESRELGRKTEAIKAECDKMEARITNVLYADQKAKADAGKPQLSLVPMQIMTDIAQVREYGNKKYGSSDNWKTVGMKRYVDALLRHALAFVDDNDSKDEESGIEHFKHMACNMAFICHMMRKKGERCAKT